jgi:hypothetical protein
MGVAMHISGMAPLSTEDLQKYYRTRAALGLMAANLQDATLQQRRMREMCDPVYRHMRGKSNLFNLSGFNGLSDKTTEQLRIDINMLGRVIAQGFVRLCSLDRFRDAREPSGFIDKATLLQRLQLPARYILHDVPKLEQNSKGA